jgi:hypothetical protein
MWKSIARNMPYYNATQVIERYGSTTGNESTRAEKEEEKGILLPYLRPENPVLLDLQVRFSDMF